MALDPRTSLAVAAAGATGAVTRWAVTTALDADSAWPYPTLLVNVVGCLLLGIVFDRVDTARVVVGLGFCGGLTTFSTFAVDVASSIDAGDTGVAATTVAASVVLGVVSFELGRRAAGGRLAT